MVKKNNIKSADKNMILGMGYGRRRSMDAYTMPPSLFFNTYFTSKEENKNILVSQGSNCMSNDTEMSKQ